MAWVDLVSLLALLEFFGMIYLVGWARGKYKVRAPATTGNEQFERYFRVQQNTLETLITFLPALWIAAHYWPPAWMALIGAVYLVGRIVYTSSYVRDPGTRTLGYLLSALPVVVLVIFGLLGIVRSFF